MAAATAATATAATAAAATAEAQPSHPAASGRAVLSPTQARALSSDVTDKVIVVFKNQVTALPDTPADTAARSIAVSSLQRDVRSELAVVHARNVTSISLVNAVAATVSPGAATLLAANPAVAEVIPDAVIRQAASPAVKLAPAAGFKPLPGACAPKGKVELDPEAIEAIHAAGSAQSAQGLGYTGAGVKVAYVADGINVNDPDFIRANGKHVFVDYKDFSGTGTSGTETGGEAFLDSSSIAAQGREVYNVETYGAGLTVPCDIRILGVAPGVSMVGLNVFSPSGDAYTSSIVEAVNYAVTKDHVNVINESLGSNYFPDVTSLDLFDQVDQAAVRAGVTVTASSGDSGVTNTIASPASDQDVISAGASTTFRGYAQVGAAGITAPGVTGWLDDNISGISSAGFEQAGATVDVVAPGDQNWALCSPNAILYSDCTNAAGNPTSFQLTGGTSEAAPLTAGVAALVIQAYREAHGGATPSPAVVKQVIASTAENIDAPADQQGAGLIDAYQAVLAARSYHVAKRAGQAVLASATQLNAVAQPGTSERFTDTLTNDGAKAVTIGLSTRTLSPFTTVAARSLTLTQAGHYAATVKFTVPKGQARLSASVTAVTPADTPLSPQDAGLLNISLVSPSGKFAAYNLPQGVSDYGNAQVADPQPGTWTALISTVGGGTGAPAPAKFAAGTATWQPFGSLSARSLTLAPGASGAVTLTVATPAQAGDESGSILLRSSAASPAFAAVTSIPVTLRSLIPAPDPSSTVTGTLTVGKPVTALVTVTNSTTTPEAYFVDARLNRPATIDLATTTPRLTLPNNMGVEPEFLVPSHTTALHTAVSSPDPVYFDFSWTFGSPDIGSTTGKTATGAYSATEVPDGYWGVTPSLLGPFGANSPQNVVGAVSMTATTAAFDPAVTAGTGDLWLGSTNPAATFAPYVARSGQSVIIPVTIDPEGKAGTVVSGTLYVVDSSLFSTTALGEPGGLPFGSDVAAFPYSYTIGA